ncbi:MAG: peptide chain release factor N(5)-glutamine methyltransferase [Myxococcales bacterium]|nr:peptide chain release factor N(5)-glutamine methyltransferase [Myxococcales bacterium]
MTEESWTIGRVLRWAQEDFAKRGLSAPRLDAELLLGECLSLSRVQLITDSARPLSTEELATYRGLIKRRRASEPIAYILGEREFWGLKFRTDSRALIPRPDTETLVEVALERTRDIASFGTALDLCTGSGCVAIAFHKERPTWRVVGSDLSDDALSLARENALRLGAVWGMCWQKSDLFMDVPRGRGFDLITANPPYIPSGEISTLDADIREFEPGMALDGGDDGMHFVRRIGEEARSYLKAGGVLAMELHHDQAQRASELLESLGYAGVERRRDYGGHERVVSGRV